MQYERRRTGRVQEDDHWQPRRAGSAGGDRLLLLLLLRLVEQAQRHPPLLGTGLAAVEEVFGAEACKVRG